MRSRPQNGEVVSFDMTDAKQNWGWSDAARTTIAMDGEACTRFKNGRSTNIVVEFGCVPIPVPLLL